MITIHCNKIMWMWFLSLSEYLIVLYPPFSHWGEILKYQPKDQREVNDAGMWHNIEWLLTFWRDVTRRSICFQNALDPVTEMAESKTQIMGTGEGSGSNSTYRCCKTYSWANFRLQVLCADEVEKSRQHI